MKKIAVRGVLFAALVGAGACAVSDAPLESEQPAASAAEEAQASAAPAPAPASAAAPTGAASWRLHPIEVARPQVLAAGADLATASHAYLAEALATAGVGAGDRFEVLRQGKNELGAPFVHLAQVHRGVRVLGAEVIVHTSKGALIAATGQVLGGLDSIAGLDALTAAPALDKAAALALGKAQYLARVTSRVAALEFAREQTQLVILAREGAAPQLAWHVAFATELQGGVKPGAWNHFFDARSGALLESYNGLHTLSQASGPGGNPGAPYYWVSALDVEPVTPGGALYKADTVRLRTTNMNNGTSGQGTIATGPLDPFNDAATDDAHGFAEVVLNMLLDWQGENSIDGNGFKIVSRVHYSTNYEGAFWNGTQMTYGDGANLFYSMSGAPDVVSHEINHGYTSFHSNLTFSAQSGGMNESFSDIAGELAEAYFSNAAPDFLVGAKILRNGGAVRYLCTPRQDGSSLDHLSQYTAGVDVHYSSGIMNKTFCLIARRLGSGSPSGAATLASTRRAGRPYYLANKSFWTSGSTFQQGCQGVWSAASMLGYTNAEKCAIRQSWIDVGITCGDAAVCGGTAPSTYSYAATATSSAQQSTVNRTVALTAGQVITLGTCGLAGATFTGDTYLRLFGPGALQVGANDDACGGLGSSLAYTVINSGNYEIRGGCYAAGSCTGTVAWTIQ